MAELVFVYGSLKKEYSNHTVLGNAKLLGKGITKCKYTMVSLGGFPGILLLKETSTIKGEVYKVGELGNLDRLEGYPTFYNRVKVNVELEKTDVSAWMYYLTNGEGYKEATIIKEGEW